MTYPLWLYRLVSEKWRWRAECCCAVCGGCPISRLPQRGGPWGCGAAVGSLWC